MKKRIFITIGIGMLFSTIAIADFEGSMGEHTRKSEYGEAAPICKASKNVTPSIADQVIASNSGTSTKSQ